MPLRRLVSLLVALGAVLAQLPVSAAAAPLQQTAPPQTAALIALANEQGFPNERIILYEDKGVSSNTAIFKREAFDALMSALI